MERILNWTFKDASNPPVRVSFDQQPSLCFIQPGLAPTRTALLNGEYVLPNSMKSHPKCINAMLIFKFRHLIESNEYTFKPLSPTL